MRSRSERSSAQRACVGLLPTPSLLEAEGSKDNACISTSSGQAVEGHTARGEGGPDPLCLGEGEEPRSDLGASGERGRRERACTTHISFRSLTLLSMAARCQPGALEGGGARVALALSMPRDRAHNRSPHSTRSRQCSRGGSVFPSVRLAEVCYVTNSAADDGRPLGA
jgi:hypothetical protein